MEVLNNPVPAITGTSFTQTETAKSLMDIGREAEKIHWKGEDNGKISSDNPNKPTDKTEQEIKELKKQDAEVKKHEQAHKAAAGAYYVSGPHFEYKVGPDGKRYAVGGNVKIDTSEVPNDPEATIKKARQIKRAALAPADPSSQDRQVASDASRMEQQAMQEIAKQRAEDMKAEMDNISNTSSELANTLEDFSPVVIDYNVDSLKIEELKDGNYDHDGKIASLNSKFGKIDVVI